MMGEEKANTVEQEEWPGKKKNRRVLREGRRDHARLRARNGASITLSSTESSRTLPFLHGESKAQFDSLLNGLGLVFTWKPPDYSNGIVPVDGTYRMSYICH